MGRNRRPHRLIDVGLISEKRQRECHSMKEPFIICTKRLSLRPFMLSDLFSLHEYASDIENSKYMLHLPNATIAQTQNFLQRVVDEWEKDLPGFYEFAVLLNGKHVGAVSVHLDDFRQEGEMGWVMNKLYQGNGYATEAATAVCAFAKNELKVKKLVAHCDYRNEASCKVMQKIGLVLECEDGVRKYKESDDEIKELKYCLNVI